MAQTKATSDALLAMAEQLRQSAEQIQAAKASMNNQLHSFSWDDPVGIAFINDYHEKMKPIDNKLLPALEVYSDYLERLVGGIEEYNGGSAIHITGTENIARVLPKGSGVDPITLNENASINTPQTPLQRVSSNESLAAGIGMVGVGLAGGTMLTSGLNRKIDQQQNDTEALSSIRFPKDRAEDLTYIGTPQRPYKVIDEQRGCGPEIYNRKKMAKIAYEIHRSKYNKSDKGKKKPLNSNTINTFRKEELLSALQIGLDKERSGVEVMKSNRLGPINNGAGRIAQWRRETKKMVFNENALVNETVTKNETVTNFDILEAFYHEHEHWQQDTLIQKGCYTNLPPEPRPMDQECVDQIVSGKIKYQNCEDQYRAYLNYWREVDAREAGSAVRSHVEGKTNVKPK